MLCSPEVLSYRSYARQGKELETPERIPFRLTQNIIAALGPTGVEGAWRYRLIRPISYPLRLYWATGPFRIACEITMDLLRNNQNTLTSVLDAFVHDPLVEWEEEHRRAVRLYA